MDKPATPQQVRLALRKLENVADFCRRHGIPERTVRRMRSEENHTPIPSITLMVALALQADGIQVVPPKRKPAKKRAAA